MSMGWRVQKEMDTAVIIDASKFPLDNKEIHTGNQLVVTPK